MCTRCSRRKRFTPNYHAEVLCLNAYTANIVFFLLWIYVYMKLNVNMSIRNVIKTQKLKVLLIFLCCFVLLKYSLWKNINIVWFLISDSLLSTSELFSLCYARSFQAFFHSKRFSGIRHFKYPWIRFLKAKNKCCPCERERAWKAREI